VDTHRLYMRDTAKGETILVSGSNATFQAASSDGSRVFFTAAGDLNVCDIVEKAGKDVCEVTDLTPEVNGESAQVQLLMPGTSDNGSYAYYVARGVLSRGENSQKEVATPGGYNLYMSRHDDTGWATTFIATLSPTDEYDWANTGGPILTFGALTARVSPNGRYLAFMSNRSLTGYDNNDAVTGKPDEEVYLNDAQTGRLVCVSCSPTGGRPVGVEVGQIANVSAGSGDNVDILQSIGGGAYGDETGIAANLPGGVQIEEARRSLYQPRYLSDNGRLFFNSSDALVPRDVNGQEDVYEYEPVGLGGCTASLLTYSERSGGCVDLISSGTSSGESAFMDASQNGDDVFIITTSKLVPTDTDTAYDVYDAHVCGSRWACVSESARPSACDTADACRATPAPQPNIFGSPPSATFNGAGNATPGSTKPLSGAQKLTKVQKVCRKKPKRSRGACKARGRKGKRHGAKAKVKKAMKSSRRSKR
jgi:hypothetical protein